MNDDVMKRRAINVLRGMYWVYLVKSSLAHKYDSQELRNEAWEVRAGARAIAFIVSGEQAWYGQYRQPAAAA